MATKTIGAYELLDELGSGGYGTVYRTYHPPSAQYYATKLTDRSEKSLSKEALILKRIHKPDDQKGFPKYIKYGSTHNQNYLVMQLLGKNLYSALLDLNRQMSLGCVIKIAKQVLERLEKIHLKGIVHRDIKPQQLLLDEAGQIIYLVDFGLASKIIRKRVHKPFKTDAKTKGSVFFASVHSHMNFRLSRRDDLESLFYTLVYLKNGKLPWQACCKQIQSVNKWNTCLTGKLTFQSQLFSGFPFEFTEMFNYIKSLSYKQQPDYEYFFQKFRKIEQKLNLEIAFDWNESLLTKNNNSQIITNAASISSNQTIQGKNNRHRLKSISPTKESKYRRRNRVANTRLSLVYIGDIEENWMQTIDGTEICVLPEFKGTFDRKMLKMRTADKNDSESSEKTEKGELPVFLHR
jgi:serine/threonine protein kinase